MSETTELARRVTTLLQTKADQVTIDDEPFDPHRPAFVDVDLVDLDGDGDGDVRTTGRHVHPRRRLLLAVAGTTLLVGLAVTLRAARHSDEPAVTAGATPTTPTTEATAGPDRANLIDGPPIASVQLSSATLELHRDGATDTLCVRPAGAGNDLGCSSGLTASVVVDDTWYVAVAQTQGGAAPLVAPGWGDPPYRGDPAMPSLDEQALPTETASDAGWSFTLATPPSGVDLVWLEQGLTHIELDRPTTPPAD